MTKLSANILGSPSFSLKLIILPILDIPMICLHLILIKFI